MDRQTGGSAPRYRVLRVSSSGGVLLDLLALKPWWSRHDVSWVAVRAEDTAALLAGQRVHWEREQSAHRPLGALGAAMRSLRLLRRERPDVIISEGTGVAVEVFVAPGCCGSRPCGSRRSTSWTPRGRRARYAAGSPAPSWSSGHP